MSLWENDRLSRLHCQVYILQTALASKYSVSIAFERKPRQKLGIVGLLSLSSVCAVFIQSFSASLISVTNNDPLFLSVLQCRALKQNRLTNAVTLKSFPVLMYFSILTTMSRPEFETLFSCTAIAVACFLSSALLSLLGSIRF